MSWPIISLRVDFDQDMVLVRQRARQIAQLAGLDSQDQTRFATAVSEIARNAFRYGRNGRVEFAIDGDSRPQCLSVKIADQGAGIADLQAVLHGRYESTTGMGIGIQGARRLMDRFQIKTEPGAGTEVVMSKALPKRSRLLCAKDANRIAAEIAAAQPVESAHEELQVQNRELLRALDELRKRQEELSQLNRELEETNRGVVALYAELDEKAEHLRRADELKSTFLSHMSHEFRTPLNSIMALSQILLGRMDGELTAEQEKQVGFIHRAAQELTDLVNDLLDLAKVEAGKIELHPSKWSVDGLLSMLRGMMRPLVANSPVQFSVEPADGIPELFTDEGKVNQIVRNFVANAIKFTERGEIRVRAAYDAESDTVSISVSDTGIGIAPGDIHRIFEQWSQVDSARQRKVRGTGLGLPLSRKLAELLGGRIDVASSVGVGSTFTLAIPAHLHGEGEQPEGDAGPSEAGAGSRLLVIDDEELSRYLIRKHLADLRIDILEASGGEAGLTTAARERPKAILLDLVMPGLDGFEVLDRLKNEPATRDIPVVIHTSKTLRQDDRDRIGGRAAAVVAKGTKARDELLRVLHDVLQTR